MGGAKGRNKCVLLPCQLSFDFVERSREWGSCLLGLGGRTLFRTFEVAGVSSFFCFFVFFCLFLFVFFLFCFFVLFLLFLLIFVQLWLSFEGHFPLQIWYLVSFCKLTMSTLKRHDDPSNSSLSIEEKRGISSILHNYTTFIFQRRNGENCAGGNYLQNTCINQSKQMIRLLITGEKSK